MQLSSSRLNKFIPSLLTFVLLLCSAGSFASDLVSVQGTIIDEKTKRETEDVELKIVHLENKLTFIGESNRDGLFAFNKIPVGKYTLTIIDKDFNPKEFQFEVTPTHQPNLNFAVSPKVSWMFNWGDKGEKEHYYSHLMAKILLFIYTACLVMIFFYSILQLTLAIAYKKNIPKKTKTKQLPFVESEAPFVTVQLPMYNELYVADRIIETAAQFLYPKDRFQIQVLDDSTDETKDVIAAKVEEVAKRGINIQHVHRTDRTGYKAGALDDAMDQVQGDFIAIFDADFVPEPDFLQKAMPYFSSDDVGVVQTRWGHLNKSYSLLTELQAFGLNGHFAIEQGGRNASGHFINFNGTGGVWRKKCIEDAGGWEHDTLTEDLDLSYRAQLKGWKFNYCEHIIAPAELPITMSALKNQQHRWMKGGAECFIKMWKTILTAKGVKMGNKIHGLSHLFNSSVFTFILLLSLLTLPILHIKDSFSDLNMIIRFGSVFILSTIFLMYYYWLAFRDKTANTFTSFFRFVWRFLQFLVVSMGLSLSNTVAVIEGYLGIKSSFVRTPKFNVLVKGEKKSNKYDKKSLSIINIGELVLFLVFGFTTVNRAMYGDIGMVPFHLMLTIGYGMVFFYTLSELKTEKQ
jgi:cellulose synthase/poly-beta-1,6-N-acetylglucosamine synthase-like glycosyltransferase